MGSIIEFYMNWKIRLILIVNSWICFQIKSKCFVIYKISSNILKYVLEIFISFCVHKKFLEILSQNVAIFKYFFQFIITIIIFDGVQA